MSTITKGNNMSALSLIKRWSPAVPKILLSPQDTVNETKMVLDNEGGEYMKFNDFLILLQNGVYLEATKEMHETLLDGKAQQSLIARLSRMGYEDFDQVMKVLEEQRGTVLKKKEYEIWQEGHRATGESSIASFVGKAEGYSFLDAVDNYMKTASKEVKDCFRGELDAAYIWGCRLFDNEADARKSFG